MAPITGTRYRHGQDRLQTRPAVGRIRRQSRRHAVPGGGAAGAACSATLAAAARRRATSTARRESCWCASGSTRCSIPARRSSSSRALAAHGVYDDELAGRGLVTGIGRVSGRACMVVANDPTVKGGTYYPLTVKKHLRAQEIAGENALPCIYLVESGGAFLPKQDEVFPDRDHFGRIFFNQARLSAQGIAQIAVVHGSCTAGGAYVPAMSDHAVIVRNQGRVFLGGPPLVRAATGEDIDAESLGGADVHCRRSGVTDYYAENDTHALAFARRAVARLRVRRSRPAAASQHRTGLRSARAVRDHSSEFAQTLRCARDHRAPGRCVPGSTNSKRCTARRWCADLPISTASRSASSPTTAFLFSESALKGTHFIELCCREGIPLLFLQNIAGLHGGPGGRRRAVSPRTARSSSPRWPARRCRSTPSSSAAASARAITPCAAAPTVRDCCFSGPMRAPR